MEFSGTVFLVTRFADCVRFYRDLLGCELTAGGEDGPVAYFTSGGQRFVLYDETKRLPEVGGAYDGAAGAPRATLAFLAEDVDAEFHRLRAAGVTYRIEPKDFADWGVRSSLCSDPAGNPVEIYAFRAPGA